MLDTTLQFSSMNRLLYFGFLLMIRGCGCADKVNIEDKYYVKIQKVESSLNNKFIVNFKQNVHLIDRYKSEMTISFDLVKDLENAFLRAELFHKFSMEYKPFLVNFTVDLCSAVRNKVQIYYVNQCLRHLRNHINITENFFHCPFKKGHYEQRQYSFPDGQLKRLDMLPFGNYKTTITVWDRTNETITKIGTLNFYDSHERTRIRNELH